MPEGCCDVSIAASGASLAENVLHLANLQSKYFTLNISETGVSGVLSACITCALLFNNKYLR